jgi:drug/metabolite transporter (DMT)-like permease
MKKIIGLIIGTTGVFVISLQAISIDNKSAMIGVLACIGAAFLYAVAGALVKTIATHVDSKSLAVGNQIFAGLILLPLMFIYPIQGIVTPKILIILFIFGVFGSGIASLIYFTLIKQVGALKALTVTYLLPIFGLFWGYVILSEKLTIEFFIGVMLIIVGIILVTKE